MSEELDVLAKDINHCYCNIYLWYQLAEDIAPYPIKSSLETLDRITNKLQIISQIIKTLDYGKH